MIIKCAFCGGEIKYDIAAGKLVCGHCGASYEPREEDAGEHMEVQVLRRDACGAEIFTNEETDVTALCSFCGSANILKKRLENVRRPDGIIPFKITREQCAELYSKHLRRIPLAPRMKEGYTDSLRAIYMPFWRYTVKVDTTIHMDVFSSSRDDGRPSPFSKTHYEIHTYARYTARLKGETTGPVHDASDAFSDEISEAIGHDDIRDAVPFRSAYLSGFYADRADLPQEDAGQRLKEQTGQKLAKDMGIKGQVPVTLSERELVYFPVWFLRRDYGGRSCFAAVNGVTGKVVANMPVSTVRLTLLTILTALALCLLFFAAFPSNTMWMTGRWGKICYMLLWPLTAGSLTLRWIFEVRQKNVEQDRKQLRSRKQRSWIFTGGCIAGLILMLILCMNSSMIAAFLIGMLLMIASAVNTVLLCNSFRSFSRRDMSQMKRKEGENRV